MSRRTLILGALALGTLAAGTSGTGAVRPRPVAVAAPAQPAAPVTVTRDFYAWYVKEINDDRIPTKDTTRYPRYVSLGLRAKVRRLMQSPDGLDADYYIKAQDYEDSWVRQIDVQPLPSPAIATRARVRVVLGARSATPQRLTVDLVVEDKVWKIADVTRG